MENANLFSLLCDVLEAVDNAPTHTRKVYRVTCSICLTDDVEEDLRSILQKLGLSCVKMIF